jgi:restriction endonuclease S subunit
LDFFQSNFAEKAVEANRRGNIVPYITISALRDIPVPDLTADKQGGDGT